MCVCVCVLCIIYKRKTMRDHVIIFRCTLTQSLHNFLGKTLMQLFDDVYFMGQSFATIFFTLCTCFVFRLSLNYLMCLKCVKLLILF